MLLYYSTLRAVAQALFYLLYLRTMQIVVYFFCVYAIMYLLQQYYCSKLYKANKMQTTQTVQQFITNVTAEGFEFSINVNATFSTAGDGFWSTAQKEVFVTSISMYISTEEDGGYFSDGDLGVNYTAATWDNATDGLIYTDEAFLADLQQYLIIAGFDEAAVSDIGYSEQGMQDDERVSCDAYEFADYIRKLSNAKITTVA